MSQEAKRQLFWTESGLLVKYLGLYFQKEKSNTEPYFELGRLQLKNPDGTDINLYDGSQYIGWGIDNINSQFIEGPGNGCLFRNHEANLPQTTCLMQDDTQLIGYCSSQANKKFPFLAPFKLGFELDVSEPLLYTQRTGRNSSLSTRAVTAFSLMASQDGAKWFNLFSYDGNPPSQDKVPIFTDQKIGVSNELVDLAMFMKVKE